MGYTGSQGITGYTGSMGATAIGGAYVYTQASPATTWTINHNLGVQYVNVEVIDNSGNSLVGTYDYPTINFTNPSEISGSYIARNWSLINVTANDTNLVNITIRLYNSTSLVDRKSTRLNSSH